MSTTPLPPLPWGTDFEAWLEVRNEEEVTDAVRGYAQQARADLEGEVQRFRKHLTKQNAELDELIPMAQKMEAEVARLREALQNMLGAFDTPIQRRRLGRSSIADKAIESARSALKESP